MVWGVQAEAFLLSSAIAALKNPTSEPSLINFRCISGICCKWVPGPWSLDWRYQKRTLRLMQLTYGTPAQQHLGHRSWEPLSKCLPLVPAADMNSKRSEEDSYNIMLSDKGVLGMPVAFHKACALCSLPHRCAPHGKKGLRKRKMMQAQEPEAPAAQRALQLQLQRLTSRKRALSRVHMSMRPTMSVLLTPSVRLICTAEQEP